MAKLSLPQLGRDTAIAIGKFDAIHLGHQALLSRLVEIARARELAPMVLTFSNHPNAVLHPEKVPATVIGPLQKRKLLLAAGVENVVDIEFDAAFAALAADEFVKQFLLPLRAKHVVIGQGFRFGRGGVGDVGVLRELGLKLGFEVTDVVNMGDDTNKYSTSTVRQLLQEGQVAQAAKILGRWHCTEGIVEHGRKLGRTLGYPTANLARNAEGLLPADGVYAGYLIADGISYPAAHSVGTNDSIEAVPRLLESHVIGRDDLDLYDKQVVCQYVEKVRGWAKFDSIEQLKLQIAQDVNRATQLLTQ